MRIKSPFKDYYDGCLSIDQESEPLYVRRTSQRILKQGEREPDNIAQYSEITIIPTIVGFGYQIHPCLEIHHRSLNGSAHLYSPDEFTEWVKKCLGIKVYDEMWKKHGRLSFWSGWWRGSFGQEIKRWFDSHANFPSYSTTTNPIWVLKNTYKCARLIQNPQLVGKYDFERILPPYEAFQELRMFLSNQATPREHIPEVSNEDLIEAKGFSLKDSFRHGGPGGPARKRRKRRRKF